MFPKQRLSKASASDNVGEPTHNKDVFETNLAIVFFFKFFVFFVFVSRLTWIEIEDRYDQSGSKTWFQKPR